MQYKYTFACAHCGKVCHSHNRNRKFCGHLCSDTHQRNTVETFWSRIDSSQGINACWPWIKGRDKNGYGQYAQDGRKIKSHRMAWELTFGAIPDGMEVCHACDNPCCCNPSHLFIGTNADNMADMMRKGRNRKGENHQFARFTSEQVDEIRSLYASGNYYQHELADRYGVAQTTISKIILRRRYS